MNFLVTESSTSEADLLAQLIRESFADVAERFRLTQENAPTHPSNCTARWIDKALTQGIRFYLLRVDQQPVGCVALEEANHELCYLEKLAVLPVFRRRGCGEALVSHVIGQAKEIGAKRLEIGIIAAHFELRAWYEKLGFVFLRNANFPQLPFEVTFMRRCL